MNNGWIVAFTYEHSGDHGYTDHWEVFIEGDNSEKTAEQCAREFYQELCNGEHDDANKKLYSANLCEIKASTEAHYVDTK